MYTENPSLESAHVCCSLCVCVFVLEWVASIYYDLFDISQSTSLSRFSSSLAVLGSFVRSFIRCLFTCLLAPVLQHHLRLQCKALMHNTLLALYSPVLVGSCYKISGLAPSLIYETTIAFNRPNLFIYIIYIMSYTPPLSLLTVVQTLISIPITN